MQIPFLLLSHGETAPSPIRYSDVTQISTYTSSSTIMQAKLVWSASIYYAFVLLSGKSKIRALASPLSKKKPPVIRHPMDLGLFPEFGWTQGRRRKSLVAAPCHRGWRMSWADFKQPRKKTNADLNTKTLSAALAFSITNIYTHKRWVIRLLSKSIRRMCQL